MFTLRFGTNTERKIEPAVDLNMSIKDFMTSHGMNATRGQLTLDGIAISGTECGKTFAECGFRAGETHQLFVTVKADGANA